MKKSSSLSPAITIISIVIVVLAIGIGAVLLRPSGNNSQVQGATTGGSNNIESKKEEINRTFQMKALNVQGKEAKDQITMNIKDADKTNEILIKGSPATAKGKSRFLVLNIELSNSSKERLIIAPLDLVRLMVDEQKRAAEIYSEEVNAIKGSVVVEPDSTKLTRIGFVLTEDIVEKAKSLQVGEVNVEQKEVVTITL